MLKRAGICVEIAVVAALLGFTGLLESTAPIAQVVFFACVAFSSLSLLFCLFEDCGRTRDRENVQTQKISMEGKGS